MAPILNERCVGCHRAGEAAPMSLGTFKEARPWAKATREAVLEKRMPPWLADPQYGKFHNERRLSRQEVDTLVNWVDAGAPEGDPKDLPPAPKFETGWNIPKPDMTIDIGTDFEVPPSGVLPYKYFRVPSGFTEDKWVEAAEIRPDKRGVVHHVIVFISDPNQKGSQGGDGSNLLVGFAPGEQPARFPPGTAKLVKAGSTFLFQMHYTPNGKATTDRTYVGLKFAQEPPQYRAITGRALNFGLRIPPHDPNYEVKSTWTAKQDVRILGFMPHMHLRGKDFQYTVVYPDGRDQVALKVPKYDFNWQLNYELAEPLVLPQGSRLDCVAHFDNSANNKYNPDPNKEVRWGDQTWEEMMIGWFTYLVPARPSQVAQARN
ncbi:MAG: thiol-disulfide isomerase [Acidobacteria bacterium]|nr:thiol-disulfide isomerase [Acidobacteriota bacterium]